MSIVDHINIHADTFRAERGERNNSTWLNLHFASADGSRFTVAAFMPADDAEAYAAAINAEADAIARTRKAEAA